MTSIEKAENALQKRIEQLKTELRDSAVETTRQFLVQSIVVSVGFKEALSAYVTAIGDYAKRRYDSIKETNTALIEQHAGLMKSGNELLDQLKANPKDGFLLKKIEAAQQEMAAIQNELRRGANALQRDLTPSMGAVDKVGASVKRFAEADQRDALKRAVAALVENVRELYLTHPGLHSRGIIDVSSWAKSVSSEVTQSTDFFEAYARTGFQAISALDVLIMAVSQNPPLRADEAIARASESVSARLKAIGARFSET